MPLLEVVQRRLGVGKVDNDLKHLGDPHGAVLVVQQILAVLVQGCRRQELNT